MTTISATCVSEYSNDSNSDSYNAPLAAQLAALGSESTRCYTARYDGVRENERIDLTGSAISAIDRQRVFEQVQRYGLAIAQLGTDLSPEDIIKACSELGLLQVFVPDYLKDSPAMVTSCGMNFIPPYPHPDLPPVNKHKAFLGSTDHALHVDGANCPGLGMVKTAILYCVSKATKGGESTVFNATGALLALAQEDVDLVAPLFHPQALTRNGSSELTAVVGPAFQLVDDELRTRYSLDYTSTWNFDLVSGLREVFDRLEQLSKPGSPFYSETILEAGELLILANDHVAHGRLGFSNSESITRRMGRVLFLDRVQAAANF
jgi:hypothetical protein